MHKGKVTLLFAVVLGVVFLFCAKEIFSQDSRNIQPFKPSSQMQQSRKGELIKQWAEHYKKSYEINELYVYKAFVLGLPSACNAANDPEGCRGDMKDLAWLNNLAIGRCNALPASDRKICQRLRKRDCSGLKKDEELLCQGFLELDPKILKRGFDRKGDREDRADILRKLAFYSAFKNGSVSSCIQFVKNDGYVYKLGCRVVLSSEPQRIIDAVALDFAYYYASSDFQNKKSLCDKINDSTIREKCKQGINLSEFVAKYFLED